MLGMVWISVLVLSMFVSQKIVHLFGVDISIVMLGYPITYIFSDIFTEVYGYKQSRRIVWTGFACLTLVGILATLYAAISPSPIYENESAFDIIFNPGLFISAITIITFACGEFMNSLTLAKMKVWMNGRFLWTRTIGSTIVGSSFDNGLFFILLGTYFGLPAHDIFVLAATAIVFQISYETAATPITYAIIGFLKRSEGVDTYDSHTNFNPFSLSTEYISSDMHRAV